MTEYLTIYLCGFAVTWLYSVGTLFAHFQGAWPTLAVKDWRQDLGVAVLISVLVSVAWPIGWLIPLCMSGFMEHGWRIIPARRV
jgi:hypothetical protein